MTIYIYTKPPGYFKLKLLHEEIIAAHPGLIKGDTDETRVCDLAIKGAPDGSVAKVNIIDDSVTEAKITAIVDAHDSSGLSTIERHNAVRASAEADFVNLPGFSRWTHAEWDDHVDTELEPEIGTVAPKTLNAIRQEGHAIIAIRNALWPEFQNA